MLRMVGGVEEWKNNSKTRQPTQNVLRKNEIDRCCSFLKHCYVLLILLTRQEGYVVDAQVRN